MSMRLNEILTASEIATITNGAQNPYCNLIFKVAKALSDKELERIQTDPRINSVDTKRDIRYRLGTMNGLSQILNIPGEAKQLYQKMNK